MDREEAPRGTSSAGAAAVLRVLRGEDVSAVAASSGVPEAKLQEWCDRFVAAGTRALSEDLALSEADARAVFDESPDYILAKDRDYRFLFANRAYARFLGTPPEALVGRRDTEFLQPADSGAPNASFRALDEEVLAGGTTARSPRVLGRRDGVLHVFDVHKVPLRGAGGEVRGVLAYARDVTDAYRAEEALRASEARYRLLLEHAPVAMYVHDGENVLFANRAFASLMGASSPEALVGYPVASIAHPDDLPKLLERVRAVAEGLVVTPTTAFRALRLDGQVIDIRVMATKCLYEDRPAIQVVMLDETERLRAQSERDALEDRLRHAQRLEALGTLAGGIAHDFNNVLAVIMSSAELARVGLAPEHASRACIDDLLVATERAAALVRGILAFSREQPLARVSLHLDDLVRETARMIRATLPAAITVEVEAGAADSRVVADATQVHQVLMNLCTNAWQAMSPSRAGLIHIGTSTVVIDEAAARDQADLGVGRYVCVSVRDNGSGMDAATLARVFDPFFTTKAVGQGTGLGLSVVHGIMRGHGGGVTVRSEPGEGTEFRVYFPVPTTSVESAAKTSELATPPAVGRHILLADDEPALLSLLRRSLEHMGLRVTERSTLAGAMASLQENAAAFDLIVTDQNMSDGSGLDLVKAARRSRPELPVVLMSGHLEDAVQRGAAELGVRVFLDKPFSIAQLKAAVQAALGGIGDAATVKS